MKPYLKAVEQLYTNNLREFGVEAKAVGWPTDESHHLRFQKLLYGVEDSNPISINDLGCGYGALLTYIKKHTIFNVSHFSGYDISKEMLARARITFENDAAEWICSDRLTYVADYSFASGIFNVRFKESISLWESHIETTLEDLFDHSKRGFAFNLLTSYVDYRMDHLYYGDPTHYFDLCKKRFSKKVTLLHDYPLWEWTLVIAK